MSRLTLLLALLGACHQNCGGGGQIDVAYHGFETCPRCAGRGMEGDV